MAPLPRREPGSEGAELVQAPSKSGAGRGEHPLASAPERARGRGAALVAGGAGGAQCRGSGSLPSIPGVPLSLIDLPMVTKSCQSSCPDISTLGLGPHVSIVCCQFSLCNQD